MVYYKNKAQMALFVVVALFLVIGLVLLISFSNDSEVVDDAGKQVVDSELDLKGVELNVEECLDASMLNAMNAVGLDNEKRLEREVAKKVNSCMYDTVVSKSGFGFFEIMDYPDVDISFDAQKDYMIADMDYPIRLTVGDDSSSVVSKFNAKIKIKESVSIPIGADGVTTGTRMLSFAEGKFKLTIPQGTLMLTEEGEPVEKVSVTVHDAGDYDTLADRAVSGVYYQFEPHGARFEPPLKLSLAYEDFEIPYNTDDLEFSYFMQYDEAYNGWKDLYDSNYKFYPAKDVLEVDMYHFSDYAITVNEGVSQVSKVDEDDLNYDLLIEMEKSECLARDIEGRTYTWDVIEKNCILVSSNDIEDDGAEDDVVYDADGIYLASLSEEYLYIQNTYDMKIAAELLYIENDTAGVVCKKEIGDLAIGENTVAIKNCSLNIASYKFILKVNDSLLIEKKFDYDRDPTPEEACLANVTPSIVYRWDLEKEKCLFVDSKVECENRTTEDLQYDWVNSACVMTDLEAVCENQTEEDGMLYLWRDGDCDMIDSQEECEALSDDEDEEVSYIWEDGACIEGENTSLCGKTTIGERMVLGADMCCMIDWNTGGPCPPGTVNCDCYGHCGSVGDGAICGDDKAMSDLEGGDEDGYSSPQFLWKKADSRPWAYALLLPASFEGCSIEVNGVGYREHNGRSNGNRLTYFLSISEVNSAAEDGVCAAEVSCSGGSTEVSFPCGDRYESLGVSLG